MGLFEQSSDCLFGNTQFPLQLTGQHIPCSDHMTHLLSGGGLLAIQGDLIGGMVMTSCKLM